MKNKIIIPGLLFIVLFPLYLSAGNGGKPKRFVSEDLVSYFSDHSITIDSCSNMLLYKTVYQWVGTRYKHRSRKGIRGLDCSGFTKIIYDKVYNRLLSGGSHEIFPKTKPLNKNELQEGDMVFFRIRKGRISHVGVYLGNNKFVHSAVKGGVRIDDLDTPYYKKYFYRGGRI